jgi:HTH-type transcriptional regulator/antitoxin HigA
VEFHRSHIDDAWLAGLLALSLDEEGPAKAVEHLRKAGIALVVERHLPGTLLDGAAMCSLDEYAIVALTLRHDRLDNFWFTLMHEIGHLKFHVGRGEFAAIFDDTDAPAVDDRERQADLFAQETLLSSDKWKVSASRYTRTERAVMLDAKRFSVGPAIIAGRIRREANNYTLLKDMVGAGEVRRQFAL